MGRSCLACAPCRRLSSPPHRPCSSPTPCCPVPRLLVVLFFTASFSWRPIMRSVLGPRRLGMTPRTERQRRSCAPAKESAFVTRHSSSPSCLLPHSCLRPIMGRSCPACAPRRRLSSPPRRPCSSRTPCCPVPRLLVVLFFTASSSWRPIMRSVLGPRRSGMT